MIANFAPELESCPEIKIFYTSTSLKLCKDTPVEHASILCPWSHPPVTWSTRIFSGTQKCPKLPPPRKCRQNGAFGVGPPAPGWDGAHWVARLVRSELSLRSDTDGSDAPPGPSVSDNFCFLDRPRRVHRRRRVPVMYSIGRAWRHFPLFFRLRDGKTEYFGGATGTKWVFS